MRSFEFALLDWIQGNLRNPVMDLLMPAVTTLGNGGLIWIALAGILLLIPRYRKAGAAVLAGLALEVICCNLVLKPLIARVRPCDVNTAVQLLVARPDDFSFPSGHTGASFAAVTALYAGGNRLWIPALLLAALISFSRLYLYVHYPTDVLAGILLGAAAGWLGSHGIACVGGKLHHGL
ncbi:MAG TPA: phosphatase PAP2 family protein [Candidatus Oscillibacter avistercoris]|nr:phosphatase PAP2 family protein [Candidatus Oscillibacter avistercoris]